MINNNSYKRVLYLFLFLVYIGCSEVSPPVSFRDIKLTPKTDHEFNFDAYSIADGIFRGALWPDPDNPNFKVWLIKNGKEHFFPVSAPQRFVSWEKETTDYWNFTKGDKFDNKQEYQIEKKDKSIKFELNLPVKKSNFSFYVLQNNMHQELIIFMNINKDVIDSGVFGYIYWVDSKV